MLKQKPHAASGADRRQFGRRSSVWHAWIVTGTRQRIACCVRNVSTGGALLELAVPATLPQQFELLIEERNLSIRCELRHRGEHGIGISFQDVEMGRHLYELTANQPARPAPQTAAPGAVAPMRPRLSPKLVAEALRRPE